MKRPKAEDTVYRGPLDTQSPWAELTKWWIPERGPTEGGAASLSTVLMHCLDYGDIYRLLFFGKR